MKRDGHSVLVVALLSSCAAKPAVPQPRFANAPAVELVDDRRDSPNPETYYDLQDLDFFEISVERPLARTFDLPRSRRALGVNALDEVPDSTWFTNRIGTRELTREQVLVGPQSIESPEKHLPWTVHSTKPGSGPEGGVIITDARGVKYMIKFERAGLEEVETGAHVVVNRLLWAAGYHVPEDLIVFFRADDVVLAPDARFKDRVGGKQRRLRAEQLAKALAAVPHQKDGSIRALASRWLDGKPLGGPAPEGRRPGDPNDRIPHELRRDLRGEGPLLAWVDHTEPTRSNMLDMWVADPETPNHHYVEHYQIDFGLSLGLKAYLRGDLRRGILYELDFAEMAKRLVTLGVKPNLWHEYEQPKLRGVAPQFVAEGFDPGVWRPDQPYPPYVAADRIDSFWGAKLVARFSPDQIRAAVEAARYSDPRATDYITETLLRRQHAILAYWFARTNPLDGFTVSSSGALCFDDLAVAHDLVAAASTRYRVDRFDHAGRALGPPALVDAAVDDHGAVCTPPVSLGSPEDGYTIVRLATQRASYAGTTFVHLARTPKSGIPRVIGVWRE